MIITADPDLLYLGDCKEFIESAFTKEESWDDVVEKLRSTYAQLWVVIDQKPIAAAVTEIGAGEVHFWLAGGSRAKDWASPLAEGVLDATGLKIATIRGRVGWSRLLGWEIVERQGRDALMRYEK